MIKHYFKYSINRILKNLVFSGINIVGLAIGFTSFFILFIYVSNEKSFDKHFNDYKNIYRVISVPAGNDIPWARSLGFIKDASVNIPEVDEATQFSHCPIGTININEKPFQQEDIMSIDEGFINIFGVESVVGDLAEISEPNTAFISEDFAKKYFSDLDPMGKTIKIEALQYQSNVGEYQIRGIVKNTAPKTHFNYEILLSQKGALQERYSSLPDSKIHWVYNYFKLKADAVPSYVADKLLSVFNESSLRETRGPRDYEFDLLPIADIHLKSDYRFELKENSSKINIGLFIIISFVILLVSLMNFINLNIAKLIKRSNEFGVIRAFGAYKKQLIEQVLVEILMLCSISIIISLTLLKFIAPTINQFFEIDFDIYYSEPVIYLTIIGVLAICGAFSALFISFFLLRKASTINLLSEKNNSSGNLILKFLLVLQLAVVIILISSTLVVNKQINFITAKSLGFNKENVVVIHLKDFSKDPAVFANELKKQSQIVSVGFTSQYFGYPTQNFGLDGLGIDGSAEFVFANYDYLKTMDIQLVHNWITPSVDTIEGMILNEHLYKRLMERHGSMEALETYSAQQELEEGQIRIEYIGVAKDFNYNSAHEAVGDFAFYLNESPNRARFIHVRINPDDTGTALSKIREVWDSHYYGQEINYFFIDEKIEQQYKAETILRRVLFTFSVLGILISIIGISAFSLFISQQRTKEIGIRKVNGATINEILMILNADFIKWLAISFVIACPIAYYAMRLWLQNFAYKTTLSWWILALAGIATLFVTLITVSWHTFKAARRNPVEALRYE
ncbi:MAG: ABC transporter permease [Bacteroidales bacterium]|nr:ABC transporter permease [Bacteroidales bacterium]MCF8390905.1 ABC transporter permease [Bacteroidales bacterium]